MFLVNQKKLSPNSGSLAVAALRFLYKITLKKEWTLEAVIPAPKKPQKLPIVLSPEEVRQFLACVPSLKHRTILTTCYAAGVRISEAIRLKPNAIDSRRMVIRVEQGKGQKDRYVMLSPKLLEILRDWWRVEKPKLWLFPGDIAGRPISKDAVKQACQKAHRRCGIPKPITPHSLRPLFCHASPRSGYGPAHHPSAAWSPRFGRNHPLHPPFPPPSQRHRQSPGRVGAGGHRKERRAAGR